MANNLNFGLGLDASAFEKSLLSMSRKLKDLAKVNKDLALDVKLNFDTSGADKAAKDLDKLTNKVDRLGGRKTTVGGADSSGSVTKAPKFKRTDFESSNADTAQFKDAGFAQYAKDVKTYDDKLKVFNTKNAQKQLVDLSAAGDTARSSMGGFGKTLRNVGEIALGVNLASLSTQIVQSVVSFFKGGFDLQNQIENFTTAVAANYGSLGKEAAQKAATDIKDFTVELAATTPFTTSELFDTAQLLAVVEGPERVKESLRNVATVAAASGREMQGLALIYQQAISKGFIDTGDINQLSGRAVDFQGVLSKITGKTVGEIRKLASEGRISAETFRNTLDYMANVLTPGALDDLSNTTTGKLATLSDSMQLAALEITSKLEPVIKFGLDFLSVIFNELRQGINAVATFLTPIILKIGEAFDKLFVALGPVFDSLKSAFAGSAGSADILKTTIVVLTDTFVFFIEVLAEVITWLDSHRKIATLLLGIYILLNARQILLTAATIKDTIVKQSNVYWTKISTAAKFAYNAVVTAGTRVIALARIAQLGLNAAFRANPIGIVITAVLLLGTALYALYTNFAIVRRIVDTAFVAIKEFGLILVKIAIGPLVGFGKLIKAVFDGVTKGDFSGMKDALTSIVPGGDAIKGLLGMDKALGKVNDKWKSTEGYVNDTTEGVKKQAKATVKLSKVTTKLNKELALQNKFLSSGKDGKAPKVTDPEAELKRLEALQLLEKEARANIAGGSKEERKEKLKTFEFANALVASQKIRVENFKGNSKAGTDLAGGGGGGGGAIKREFELDTVFVVDKEATVKKLKEVDKKIEEYAFQSQRTQLSLRREISVAIDPIDDAVSQRRELEVQLSNDLIDLERSTKDEKVSIEEELQTKLLELKKDFDTRKKKLDDEQGLSPEKRSQFELELSENYNKAIAENKVLNNDVLLKLDKQYYSALDSLEQEQELKRKLSFIRTKEAMKAEYDGILAEVKAVNNEIDSLLGADTAPIERRQARLDTNLGDTTTALTTDKDAEVSKTSNTRRELQKLQFEGTVDDQAEYQAQIDLLNLKEVASLEKYNRNLLKAQLEYANASSKLRQEAIDERKEASRKANEIDNESLQQLKDGTDAIRAFTDQIFKQGNYDVAISPISSALRTLAEQITPLGSAINSLSAAQRNYTDTQAQGAAAVEAAQLRVDSIQTSYNNLQDVMASASDETALLTKRAAELQAEPTSPDNTEEMNSIQERLSANELLQKSSKETTEKLVEDTTAAGESLAEAAKKAFDEEEEAGKKKLERVFDVAQSIVNAGFSVINAAQAAKIASLDQALSAQRNRVDEVRSALLQGGDAAKNFSEAQLEAEEERARQIDTLRKKEIAKQQQYTAFQLASNAAIAIAKAFATLTFPANIVVAGITAASLIASLVAIRQSASAQAPRAKSGGIIEGGKLRKNGVLSGKRHGSGGILIEAEDGEAIFSREKTKRFQSLINGINSGAIKSERDLMSTNPLLVSAKTPIVATKEIIRRGESMRGLNMDSLSKGIAESNRRLAMIETTLRLKDSGITVMDEDGFATNTARVIHRKATQKEKNRVK